MQISLEPMRIEDCENKEYQRWLNDGSITKFLSTKSGSIDSARKYVSERINNPYSGMFKIVVVEPYIVSGEEELRGTWVGTCVYYDLSLTKNMVTLGIMMGNKEYQGKGIGKEALRQLVKHINEKWGLTMFSIGCYCDNLPAVKCYEGIGFKKSQYLFFGSKKDILGEE